jgi:heme O synthase-like polyprenyltransferase
MGNLTVHDRNQYERANYQDAPRLTGTAERRLMVAYSVIGLVVLAVLTFAAVQIFDGWHHAIIIADLVIVFFGLAAWVWPERKHV